MVSERGLQVLRAIVQDYVDTSEPVGSKTNVERHAFGVSAATIWWANGLSSPPGHVNPSRHGVTQQGPDERVQQITRNLFQRMIG